MIDFLIIGSGIAGISFAELAITNGKSIHVFDDFSTNSSRIAGGLYNPVVLKRFSEVWKAKEQIEFSLPFLNHLENKLGVSFDFKVPLYRKFASIEEQNNWFQAADKPSLEAFLSDEVIYKNYRHVEAKYGFGSVFHTGYVEIATLIKHYVEYLSSLEFFFNASFNYEDLVFHTDFVTYKGNTYKDVVFAEGFGVKNNPFFNYLPLDGTKGELLIIKAPDLDLDVILKSSVFIVPIGNGFFKVGATYNWEDKTDIPTEEGKKELVDNLNELIDCKYEIVQHFAGVRPTVKDRRPLVGSHHLYKNLHILNGLGTRGVMLGPWLAKCLFDCLEFDKSLDLNIDVKRFDKRNNIKRN